MIVCSCNVLTDHDVRTAVVAETPRTAGQPRRPQSNVQHRGHRGHGDAQRQWPHRSHDIEKRCRHPVSAEPRYARQNEAQRATDPPDSLIDY